MQSNYDIAGGSVTGRAHRHAGRANQDGYAYWADGDAFVAIVADGCGSGRRSEVGAALAVQLFVAAFREVAPLAGSVEAAAEHARSKVVAALAPLAVAMAGAGAAPRAHHEVVVEHFLFTLVAALGVGGQVGIFGLGDGVVIADERVFRLGPYPGNEPPYLGYELLDGRRRSLETLATFDVEGVTTISLGTDGFADLGDDAATCSFIREVATDARVFRNPDMVRRRLVVCERSLTGAGTGAFTDDTTVVVVRRRSPPDGAAAAGGTS